MDDIEQKAPDNTFVDKLGRRWVLDITLGDCKRVRDACSVDLETLIDDNAKGLLDLFADRSKLAGVVWVLVAEQAEKQTIKAEEFVDRINGKTLAEIHAAMKAAILDFFQTDQAKQAGIRQILQSFDELSRTTLKRASERFESAKNKILENLAREVESMPLPGGSGNAPDASASAPPTSTD